MSPYWTKRSMARGQLPTPVSMSSRKGLRGKHAGRSGIWKPLALVCVIFAGLFYSGALTAITGVFTQTQAHAAGVGSSTGSTERDHGYASHVLVTGGAGFIGSHAALKLLETGHKVTVLDNLSRGNAGAVQVLERHAKKGQLNFWQVDLGDRARLCSSLKGSSVDLVMHFAAIAYVSESVSDPLLYYENITASTINLLHCMQDADVKQLVYSSTCATYGNPAQLPITEQTETVPVSPYGKAKLMSEDVIRDFARKDPSFRAGILRYFNVYGSDEQGRLGEFPRPDLRRYSRITGACMDAALGTLPSLTVMGTTHPTRDGSCIRDFIHVVDLVQAHVMLMPRLTNPPVLFNVGTGKGVSVIEIVEACKEVTGVDINVVMQREARPGDAAEVWADPAAIMGEVGWSARYTDVKQGLKHAWDWRKVHPNGY